MMHLGGAPARVAPTLNAVGFRSAQYVLNITAAWEASHEDQQHIGWAREFWGAAHPLSTGIGYTNFMTEDEGDARVRAAYGEELYARLRKTKTSSIRQTCSTAPRTFRRGARGSWRATN